MLLGQIAATSVRKVITDAVYFTQCFGKARLKGQSKRRAIDRGVDDRKKDLSLCYRLKAGPRTHAKGELQRGLRPFAPTRVYDPTVTTYSSVDRPTQDHMPPGKVLVPLAKVFVKSSAEWHMAP
ncbi:hypothetical protein J6590_073870 [Homalodisca vitripennis]|nr:hypothetical protein J6590_073870 [Homalodisca vitripennis]